MAVSNDDAHALLGVDGAALARLGAPQRLALAQALAFQRVKLSFKLGASKKGIDVTSLETVKVAFAGET